MCLETGRRQQIEIYAVVKYACDIVNARDMGEWINGGHKEY